jgi:hypothetical protein
MTLVALDASTAQDAGGDAPAASILNPLASLALDSLEATRSLPLFTPTRAPPFVPEPEVAVVASPSPPPPPAPPAPPALVLVGLVATGSAQFALLRDVANGEVVRLSAGDEYEGWSIEFVDARTVGLRNGDQTETLTMFGEFEAIGPDGLMHGFPPGFGNRVPPFVPE